MFGLLSEVKPDAFEIVKALLFVFKSHAGLILRWPAKEAPLGPCLHVQFSQSFY